MKIFAAREITRSEFASSRTHRRGSRFGCDDLDSAGGTPAATVFTFSFHKRGCFAIERSCTFPSRQFINLLHLSPPGPMGAAVELGEALAKPYLLASGLAVE